MTIGLLRLELFIPASNSLKEKRMVLEGLKKRLRNNFNIAVIQGGEGEDKWQKAAVAVVGVSNTSAGMNSILSRVINFVEASGQVALINHEMEMI